jgi:hypothetical protein
MADFVSTGAAYLSELEGRVGNATLDFLDNVAECLEAPLMEFFRSRNWVAKNTKSMLAVGRALAPEGKSQLFENACDSARLSLHHVQIVRAKALPGHGPV